MSTRSSSESRESQVNTPIRSESAIEILLSLKEGELRFSQLYIKTKLKPLILHRQIQNLTKLELIGKNDEHFYITPKGRKLLDRLNELIDLRFK